MSQTPRGCVDLMFFLSHFSLKYIVICISTELRQEPPPVPDGDRAPPALGNKVSISGHPPVFSTHLGCLSLLGRSIAAVGEQDASSLWMRDVWSQACASLPATMGDCPHMWRCEGSTSDLT